MHVRLHHIVIDAHDVPGLARFWTQALGWKILSARENEISGTDDNAPVGTCFMPVTGPTTRPAPDGAPPMMTTANEQIEYLPLFVYGTLLERSTRDSVLGPSVLRTERAAASGRWEKATEYPAVSFRDPVSEISGELIWLIPERLEVSLQRADQYEGAPRLYRRVLIYVRAGEKEVRAYAYEWARSA